MEEIGKGFRQFFKDISCEKLHRERNIDPAANSVHGCVSRGLASGKSQD